MSIVSQSTITLLVLLVAVGLFIWNRIPAAAVAVLSALALFLLGVLDLRQTVSGFGDPVVVFIACLLAVGCGLETTGVGTYIGQRLISRTGSDPRRITFALMLSGALFAGLIGMNGAVATMVPIAVVVAVRTALNPSRIMIPIAFGCLTGAKLTLLGTPVNVIAVNAAQDAGGSIGFFAWSVVGIPLVIGTLAIVWFLGDRLLPMRENTALPADFSAHAHTLVEQYRLDDGVHRLRVRSASPLIGKDRSDIDQKLHAGLSLVSILDGTSKLPLERSTIAADDRILMRGDAEAIGRFAAANTLAVREQDEGVADTLFNAASGLAEIVIPPRSGLIGQVVFPGMAARSGDLMVLAIQRGGDDLGGRPIALAAGDHLLLQGTWQALDKHLADPQVLVVDSPEVVRRQALALGPGATQAIGILCLLIVLLATNLVPPAIAGMICAVLLVLTGVLTVQQFYRGIDWNTLIIIGGMFPLAAAMTQTGAAALLGDIVVQAVGFAGPRAIAAGLFLVAAVITQFIANTSAALIMIPIAVSTAAEVEISPMPLIMAVALGASASFLTPVGTPVNLMVHGPGGYEFADYWRLGLPVVLLSLLIALFVAPLYWPF